MNAVRKVADKVGVKVRVYVPYGEAYLPYALSQVRKKPQILWWVMRDVLIAK
jgi:proline dehydrogenase